MTISTINDLVRDGRTSPEDGAMLIELRNDLAVRSDRKVLRRNPFAQLAVVLGLVVLAILGVRRH